MNNHEQAFLGDTCEKCKDCIYVGGYCWMAWDPDQTDALVFLSVVLGQVSYVLA